MIKILFIFLFSSFLFADTTSVNGNVDGVWSQSGSPYVITNNLVIQPDDTLIIEPGTEILFDGHYRIDVFGLLLAVGTEEDSIIFNSLNSPDLSDSNYYEDPWWAWASINFGEQSNDSSSISYCKIINASSSGYEPYYGALNANHSNPKIKHNLFRSCWEDGVSLTNSLSIISDNTFDFFTTASVIIDIENGRPTVSNNKFLGKNSYTASQIIGVNANNTIMDYSEDGNHLRLEIIGNEFKNNIGGNNFYNPSGVYQPIKVSDCSYPRISNNIITQNSMTAIYFEIYYGNNVIFDSNKIINNISQNYNEWIKIFSVNGIIFSNNEISYNNNLNASGDIIRTSYNYGNEPLNHFYNNKIISNDLHQNSNCISLEYSHGIFNNNIIADNDGQAIYISGGTSEDTYIFRNTIDNNWTGIYLYYNQYSNFHIFDNSITSNGEKGLHISNSYNVSVENNNLWNNAENNITGGIEGLGNLVTINNNGTVSDIYFNISENPYYKNPLENNYKLHSQSPLIDAGKNDTTFTLWDTWDEDSTNLELFIMPNDPDGTISDIGKYYFIPSPTILLNSNSIFADIDLGATYEDTIKISNAGDSLLVWSADIDSPWVSLDNSSGTIIPGDTLDLILSFNVNEFEAGNYNTQIHFSSNDPDNPVVDFDIALTIRSLWNINISASIADISDSDNILGMHESASDGYDDFDIPDPPPEPNEYIQLAFYNPEWSDVIQEYSHDIRQFRNMYGNDIETWDLVLYTDSEQTSATIDLAVSDNFPEGYTYWLILDNDTTDITNISNPSISISNGSGFFSIMVKGIIPDPPVVNFTSPDNGSIYRSNESVELNWIVENEVWSFDLLYSEDGGDNYLMIESNIDGTIRNYNWLAPNELYITNLYFRLDAYGPGETSGQTVTGPYAIVPYQVTSELLPGWNMFGLALDDPYPEFFGDNIHIFSFNSTLGYNLVDEVTFNPGSGYWAAVFESTDYQVTNNLNLDSTNISLEQGWNLISGTMPFDVDTSLISVIDSNNDTISFSNAVSQELLTSSAMYYWDGNSYQLSNSLMKSKALWLSANTNLNLIIPPEFYVDNSEMRVNRTQNRDENNWEIPFSIETIEISDYLTAIGVIEDANLSFDPEYDIPAPPVPPSGDFIHGYFYHPEWDVITGAKFSTDITSPIEQGNSKTWNLTIDASVENDILLSWPELETILPENYQATINFQNGDDPIDMSLVTAINIEAIDIPISLDITISSLMLNIDLDMIPEVFALHQNYPNPFNPTTKIKYDLPEDALVTIKIFDIMGRNIRTLVNTKQTAGYRLARWDATNDFGESVSAGMYIYTIQTGEFSSTKKMLYLK